MLMRLFWVLHCSRRLLAQVSPVPLGPPTPENICQTQPPPLATARIALAVVSRQPLLMSRTSCSVRPMS